MTAEAEASGTSRDVPFSADRAYTDHAGGLFGFVVNAVGDRAEAEAEDILQEVFTRAWRASSRDDPDRASVRT